MQIADAKRMKLYLPIKEMAHFFKGNLDLQSFNNLLNASSLGRIFLFPIDMGVDLYIL